MRDGLDEGWPGALPGHKAPARTSFEGCLGWVKGRAEPSPATVVVCSPHFCLSNQKCLSLQPAPGPGSIAKGRRHPMPWEPQQHPVLLPPLLLVPCSHSSVTAWWVSGKPGRFPTPLLHWGLITGCYRDPPVPAPRQDSPTCTPWHPAAQGTAQGQHPG